MVTPFYSLFTCILFHIDCIKHTDTKIEPHGRGVPKIVPNGHSPFEGAPVRGEWPLGTTEGISSHVVLFIIPLYPLKLDTLDIFYCHSHEGRMARVSHQ